MASEAYLSLKTRLKPEALTHPANHPRLHVLTLTPFYPFASNPVYGTYVSEPIQQFADYNLQSTVIGVSPIYRKRHLPAPGVESDWLRYPQIPGNMGLTTAGVFLSARLSKVVDRLHRKDAIDIIHAHAALPCGHAASRLAPRLRIPFVVTLHGLDVFNACFAPETSAAKRRAGVSAEVYRRASSVICISQAIQEVLKEGMRQPIQSDVIYNGTDTELFSPDEGAQGKQSPTILMVGNLLRGKGQEVVLRAMALIERRFPSLRCDLIGEGSDMKRFASLARDLGISSKVTFMGRQSRQAVAKAMRQCSIFALPSCFEGLGCAYLEAMACAKPVIACVGQGIGEIIQHGRNGWLIPANDVNEMANALTRLLDSPDLRANIGKNARQTILNGLTLKDQASRLNTLYRDIVNR